MEQEKIYIYFNNKKEKELFNIDLLDLNNKDFTENDFLICSSKMENVIKYKKESFNTYWEIFKKNIENLFIWLDKKNFKMINLKFLDEFLNKQRALENLITKFKNKEKL